MKKRNVSLAGNSVLKASLLGLVAVLIVLLLLSLLTTALIYNEFIEWDVWKIAIGISQFVAYFTGCMLCKYVIKERGFVAQLITTGVGLFLQLAVAILFFDGVGNNALLSVLPAVAACGCSILLKLRHKKATGNSRRRFVAR